MSLCWNQQNGSLLESLVLDSSTWTKSVDPSLFEEHVLHVFAVFSDEQVVPNSRSTRGNVKSSNLTAFLESASASQLGGQNPSGKEKKQKGARIQFLDKANVGRNAKESVNQGRNSSSSSAVSFKVPRDAPAKNIKSPKFVVSGKENNNSPQCTEMVVSPCDSSTRRKVSHWITEQCATPSSLREDSYSPNTSQKSSVRGPETETESDEVEPASNKEVIEQNSKNLQESLPEVELGEKPATRKRRVQKTRKKFLDSDSETDQTDGDKDRTANEDQVDDRDLNKQLAAAQDVNKEDTGDDVPAANASEIPSLRKSRKSQPRSEKRERAPGDATRRSLRNAKRKNSLDALELVNEHSDSDSDHEKSAVGKKPLETLSCVYSAEANSNIAYPDAPGHLTQSDEESTLSEPEVHPRRNKTNAEVTETRRGRSSSRRARPIDLDSVFTKETESGSECGIGRPRTRRETVKVQSEETCAVSDSESVESYAVVRPRQTRKRSKNVNVILSESSDQQSSFVVDSDEKSSGGAAREIVKTGDRISLLRGTPPSRFKGDVSSPGSDDPFAFKSSQKTPQDKRRKGRKGKTARNAKRKPEVVVIGGDGDKAAVTRRGDPGKDPVDVGDNSNEVAVIEEKMELEQSTEILAERDRRARAARGVKTVFAYGKEPEVVLFDDVQEHNTDPFSSPMDVGESDAAGAGGKSVEKCKENRKVKPKKVKKPKVQKTPSEEEPVVQITEELEEAEDYEFVFSQQVREEAEEYRKMFKKKTKNNPRTNRVTFGDTVEVEPESKEEPEEVEAANTNEESKSHEVVVSDIESKPDDSEKSRGVGELESASVSNSSRDRNATTVRLHSENEKDTQEVKSRVGPRCAGSQDDDAAAGLAETKVQVDKVVVCSEMKIRPEKEGTIEVKKSKSNLELFEETPSQAGNAVVGKKDKTTTEHTADAEPNGTPLPRVL